MKTILIASVGTAIAALLSLLLFALAPAKAKPASVTESARTAPAGEHAEIKHVGMGENQPL